MRAPWVDEAVLGRVLRYYRLTRRQRMLLAAGSLIVVFVSASILLVSASPLYFFTGGYIEGVVGFTGYRLSILGAPVRVPVLDSIKHLSFVLVLGPLLASALVLPSLYYSLRGSRAARSALEAAVAGLVVAGLTSALFASFTRLLLADVVNSIPRGASVATEFGRLVFDESSSGYTPQGLYALRLAYYLIPASLVFIAAAALLHYHMQRYYMELVEDYILWGNHS
jgi:hypothetical protein